MPTTAAAAPSGGPWSRSPAKSKRRLHTRARSAWEWRFYTFDLWLQPKHNIGTVWFVLNSMVLAGLHSSRYLLSLYIRARVSRLMLRHLPAALRWW